MRIYSTEHALFSEYYEWKVGVRQVVTIRISLIEQVNAALHLPLDAEGGMLGCALNFFAAFYEKDPNPQDRAVALANEIGTYTARKFQKASELLSVVDPEWEVPVVAVTWLKKTSDINQVLGNPICSKCKKELENIGNFFDDVKAGGGVIYASYSDGLKMSRGINPHTTSGHDQWSETICPNCDSIFCPDCLSSGGQVPCPVCQARVIPALAKDLPFRQNFSGKIINPIMDQSGDDGVVFVREIKKQTGQANTCMVYRADSAQAARDFLAKHPLSADDIMVETPDGNFGMNKDGIYREQR